jgi:PAS domain S-box-containing protein
VVRSYDLVHCASDAAFAVDPELRVVAWNERAEELLGYRAEEVHDRPCWDVLQGILPDGGPLCTPDCHAKLCFGCCRPYGVRLCLGRHKGGHWVKLSLSSVAIPRRDEGEISAVIFLRPFDAEVAVEESRQDKSLDPLRVFALGRFALVVGGRGLSVERWTRKQAVTLLKVLGTQLGRAVTRERLIETLWPGSSERRGRDRLKVTVYTLRKELAAAGIGPDLIHTENGTYLLRREGIWLDADVFESRVREGHALERRGHRDDALRCYREAEALYGGDYLEEDRYEDWCAEERERLRELYLGLLQRMAVLLATEGDHAGAAWFCRKALVQEPCREAVHRALMEYLWRQGRRDEALQQYRRLTEVLARELGVQPLPETERLHEQILQTPAEAVEEKI